jgi:hypothetical protein
MKSEHQQIEWKETWRDEYLKWISGFANAEGGVLIIGMNDKGKVVGVPDARKLLVDLPNKVRDVLGILVKVNLKRAGQNEYLEIVVDPYPFPSATNANITFAAAAPSKNSKVRRSIDFSCAKWVATGMASRSRTSRSKTCPGQRLTGSANLLDRASD